MRVQLAKMARSRKCEQRERVMSEKVKCDTLFASLEASICNTDAIGTDYTSAREAMV